MSNEQDQIFSNIFFNWMNGNKKDAAQLLSKLNKKQLFLLALTNCFRDEDGLIVRVDYLDVDDFHKWAYKAL